MSTGNLGLDDSNQVVSNLSLSTDKKTDTLKQNLTIEDVEKLLKLFWPERAIGIFIGLISLTVLIWCAFTLLNKDKPDASSVISMCGSSGGIMVSFGMVYKMFNDLMKRLR